MASEGAPIDWRAFYAAGRDGRFMELLVKLPCERWAERNAHDDTLLLLACRGPNVAAVVALLQSGLVDVDASKSGWTPAHWAAWTKQPRVLEVLCAAGADLRACTPNGNSPLEFALLVTNNESGGESVRVLVANGVRLSTVWEDHVRIPPELAAFERGVLRCRAAVVAMLRVKRAGKLVRWDKFLLLELALCIWSTRSDKGWQAQ